MTTTISIRRLLELRISHSDQLALDYLSLAALLRYTPGVACVQQLQQRWNVSQSSVSRRVAHLATAGLIEVTNGSGVYHVHQLKLL